MPVPGYYVAKRNQRTDDHRKICREQATIFAFLDPKPLVPIKKYEYAVLVKSLPDEILTIAQHSRDRAYTENAYDELKNQWCRGGFTTKDLLCCQVMAQHTALI